MTNILLDGFNIDAPWLYSELKGYISPKAKVAIVAFSFRDNEVKRIADWYEPYSRERGKYYSGIVGGLMAYGVSESNITFVNYFTDSKDTAKQKIKNADIVYFPGGLPDRMIDRIKEFDLYETLLNHNGVIMGFSAGAVIQLAEYHLSPDDDYETFSYYKGIPYLNDFYLEVHYENTQVQNSAIEKVLAERNKPVYATSTWNGAIIVHDGTVKLLGDVYSFR